MDTIIHLALKKELYIEKEIVAKTCNNSKQINSTTILCLRMSEWNNIKSLNLTSKNKIEAQKCEINLHILLINDKNVIVHTKCDNSKITLYLSLCSHPASFCGLNIIVILIEENCIFFVPIPKKNSFSVFEFCRTYNARNLS